MLTLGALGGGPCGNTVIVADAQLLLLGLQKFTTYGPADGNVAWVEYADELESVGNAPLGALTGSQRTVPKFPIGCPAARVAVPVSVIGVPTVAVYGPPAFMVGGGYAKTLTFEHETYCVSVPHS